MFLIGSINRSSLIDVIMDRFVMLREMVFVLKSSPADFATESWLDTAFHALVQVQRLFPLIRFSAVVTEIARTKHKNW